MPNARKLVEILSIALCITVHDRKRSQMEKCGKCHSIYMKFNRWLKNGTIQRIFDEMQESNMIDIRSDVLCIDGTIKIYHDAAGVRKLRGIIYAEFKES